KGRLRRSAWKSWEHNVGSLTSLDSFGASLFNCSEQIANRAFAAAGFRKIKCGNYCDHQDRDDRDDDEQFDQRKRASRLRAQIRKSKGEIRKLKCGAIASGKHGEKYKARK